MYHLITLPVIFVAVIVLLVATQFSLKILKTIAKAVIVIGVIIFIYTYSLYNGFDMLAYIKNFISF